MGVRELTVGLARLTVDDEGHASYWDRVAGGTWEPGTVAALGRLCGPGVMFVDVGAWIGPTALIAAAAGATVVAYEPDPVARACFERNLALNPDLSGRVRIEPVAITAQPQGDLVLYAGRKGFGDSTASAVGRDDRASITVETLPVGELPACDVLKMDVEGLEFDLLPHLIVRPGTVLLSTHARYLHSRWRDLPRVVRVPLRRLAYQRNVSIVRRFARRWERVEALSPEPGPVRWSRVRTRMQNWDLLLSRCR